MLALYTRSSCPRLGKAADRSHLAAASVTCLQRSGVSRSGWLDGYRLPKIRSSPRVEVILPNEPQRSMGLRTLPESGEPNSLRCAPVREHSSD
jgi:hypothetical protein